MTTDTKNLPLFDLARAWPALEDDATAAFARIAAAGAFSLGADLRAFEEEFAAYCGTEFCIGVANGTVAIELALLALGAGPGREVVTVPHTFVATVEAIGSTGATPVLVDVDPVTRCIDPAGLEAAINERTAAVVPVHLYGRVAPMDEVRAICAKHGVPIVEDGAQAHGAKLDGRRVGSLGTAGAFSFYPTKNLGAFGDGGAVVTDDPEVDALVRSLRHHGSAPGDANRHERLGRTERLDNLQAAILRLKLPRLDDENAQRQAAAARYRELLDGLPLTLPPEDDAARESVYHLFAVEVSGRDAVRAELNAAGIGAGVHYPTPVHLQPYWREQLGHAEGAFPASERLASRVLTLPIFPGITDDELERVAVALRTALN